MNPALFGATWVMVRSHALQDHQAVLLEDIDDLALDVSHALLDQRRLDLPGP